MRKLERTKLVDQYIKEEFVKDKYLYYKVSKKDTNVYYIFKCKNIISNNPLIYSCSKCFVFSVPIENNRKCFVYDNYKIIKLPPKVDLYKLSFTEFVDTFRVFVKNDGKYPNDLPSKIIQDVKL